MNQQSKKTYRDMDRTGMILSAICLVHCLLLPPLLALLPMLTHWALPNWLNDTEVFHAALLVPVVLVSAPVLGRAAKRDWRLGLLACVAFAALVSALFVPEEYIEQGLTICGAGLLGLAHWFNLKTRAT